MPRLFRSAPSPEPDDGLLEEERFTLPARMVDPVPASKQEAGRILKTVIACAVIVVIACGAAGFAAWRSIQTSNDVEHRAKVRDTQQRQINAAIRGLQGQLSDQQKQLVAQEEQLQASFQQAKNIVCTTVVTNLEHQFKVGLPLDTGSLAFARNFGCPVPPELSGL